MKKTVVIGTTLFLLSPWLEAGIASAGMVDPTRPPTFTRAKRVVRDKAGLVLQSTLVSPGRQVVIISGRTYGLGGRVDGAVITKISPYEVTLSRNGRATPLRFFPKLVEHNPVVEQADEISQ